MRVLVAEDHDDLRELLKITLENAGFQVFAAKDGREALRVYHDAIEGDHYFDCLLLDVDMPRLNGFAVGVNVRNLERFGDVPRAIHIYLTGHGDVVPPKDLLDCLFADAYLHKPVGPQELIDKINKLVGEAKRKGGGTHPLGVPAVTHRA